MEEFLKRYFVEHKKLIFDNLGTLVLNTTPAYIDKTTNQLYPLYFNFAFFPDKKVTNTVDFFSVLAHTIHASSLEAQTFYTNFVQQLTVDLNNNDCFIIQNFLKVHHFNETFVVEADTHLQLMLNPIDMQINNNNNPIKQPTIEPIAFASQIHHSELSNKPITNIPKSKESLKRLIILILLIVCISLLLIFIKIFILKQPIKNSSW